MIVMYDIYELLIALGLKVYSKDIITSEQNLVCQKEITSGWEK